MAKDTNKIDAARSVYERMNTEPRHEKLGKGWRKAVIAEMVEKIGSNCSHSSAATMFNTIRKENGGKSTKRVPKQPKAIESLEVKPRDENGKRVGFVLTVNGLEFAMTNQLNKALIKSIGQAEEAPVAPAPPPPVAKEKGKPGRKPGSGKKAAETSAPEGETEKPKTWQVVNAEGVQTGTYTSRDTARAAAKEAGEGYTASKLEATVAA